MRTGTRTVLLVALAGLHVLGSIGKRLAGEPEAASLMVTLAIFGLVLAIVNEAGRRWSA